jgi:hypothetical protein
MARSIEHIRPRILSLESGIPRLGEIRKDPLYNEILTLDAFGFVSAAQTSVEFCPEDPTVEQLELPLANGTLVFQRSPPPLRFELPMLVLTQSAKEILGVLPPVDPSTDMIESVRGHCNRTYGVSVEFLPGKDADRTSREGVGRPSARHAETDQPRRRRPRKKKKKVRSRT